SKPKGDIKLEILDGKDRVVRTLTSKKPPAPEAEDVGDYSSRKPPTPLPTEPGLHRVVWDLRWRGAVTIKGARVDSGRPDLGPLANPGVYTVRLTVEEKKSTTKVQVKLDPRQPAGFTKELTAQLAL